MFRIFCGCSISSVAIADDATPFDDITGIAKRSGFLSVPLRNEERFLLSAGKLVDS